MKIEPFLLERWMTRHETHVKFDIAESGILPLSTHDLLQFEPEDQRASTREALLHLPLGYSEARGTLALRKALASTYAAVTADQILVTTGAIEANYLLFNVLLDAGDHVIAPYPAYQQLYSVPKAIGCDVSLWRVGPETDYRYDVDALERLITPQTKLIVVNTPHNPTGAMLSPADAARVYALADSVGAWVLGDEAYRWLSVPDGDPFAPPVVEMGARGISVGTLSKPYGLPGLRIGWIAGPADVVERCWGMRDYITLSPGKLNDALACLALRHHDQIMARNRDIITTNLKAASAWMAASGEVLSWTPPRGGLLALLKYDLPVDSLTLADMLATEYSVMLAPGAAFGYEHHLRLGIGQQPDIFAAGLVEATRGLERWRAAR
ncbi:MAG: aminotransferase class I/II-fold pyridoxal phosphate-dependent enzyme [Acidobacteria bacterium]|jgi:aspartate/methionine/tyrosine aminotransferase|nr:aminotransferase class I/II-fold pyridoxal phosphate-dependent enzyme [Acidobacteriota bacterium]